MLLFAKDIGTNSRVAPQPFVGDSVWELLAVVHKRALGVGFLAGGYGQEELERAGAFRVYSDAADMLMHLERLGLPGK